MVLRALRCIADEGAANGLRVTRASSLYESGAVGMPQGPPFINAVCQVHALLSPVDLLKRLKTIEKRMGRRGGHNAPREIDLDIIAYGQERVEAPDLTIPHPRYNARAFVLVPLREIEPAFVCPCTGHPIDGMIANLAAHDRVIRISRRSLIPRDTP
jgi:2-amino-4-hydroxy-6-hydroxymethyldihydropteridine diphosphokinase